MPPEKFDWKRTIKYIILLLQVIGLWPKGDETYSHNFYTVYAIFSVLVFQLGNVFFQTINFYFIRHDLKALTASLVIVIQEYAVFLKSYCLMKNMKLLKQVMTTLNSDIFQPKTPLQRKLVEPNLKIFIRLSSVLGFFSFGCVFFWCLFPVIDGSYKEHRLPFLAWYPYDSNISPFYQCTYLYQIISLAIAATASTNLDMLISALNMYTGAQLDLLRDNLSNLRQAENSFEDVRRRMKQNINHHREILYFAKCANQFYNWLLFLQFSLSGVVIGISMFQLTLVSPSSGEFHAIASYLNGLFIQIFIYCWYGDEVLFKSRKLAYAIFESNWTDLPVDIKRDLIFLTLRFQKSITIAAFGLFSLSLQTFMKIIKTAFSYFTLLQQVNSEV